MKYMLQVYKYVSEHPTREIQPLKRFAGYCDEKEVSILRLDFAIEEFKETDYWTHLAETTRKQYLPKIHNFVKYVFESEGFDYKELLLIRASKKKEEKQREQEKEGWEDLSKYPEEYREFREKYTKLAGEVE